MSQLINKFESENVIHVAVAVVKDQFGKILITKRPDTVDQGGLWEFPGGKVESNENVRQALKRELYEEVGLTILTATPLIKIQHDYGDKSVLLDVFMVNLYNEDAYAKEGQKLNWVKPGNLSDYEFPVANYPIIDAILLPDKYMITGEFENDTDFINMIQAGLNNGIKLIQFRAHHLDENKYFEFAKIAYETCQKHNAKLILNTSVKKYIDYYADGFSHGLHLSSNELKKYSKNILNNKILVSASIHNEEELILAQQKKTNFVVLSPVNKTNSHPDSNPLGWNFFQEMAEKAIVPVFALGGMQTTDLARAKNSGAQGISGIGLFWKKQ